MLEALLGFHKTTRVITVQSGQKQQDGCVTAIVFATSHLDVGSTCVDELRGVLRDHANFVFGHKLLNGHARERPIDVQAFGKDRWSNQLVFRGFLVQLLICVLVEENKVVRLLLNLFE